MNRIIIFTYANRFAFPKFRQAIREGHFSLYLESKWKHFTANIYVLRERIDLAMWSVFPACVNILLLTPQQDNTDMEHSSHFLLLFMTTDGSICKVLTSKPLKMHF